MNENSKIAVEDHLDRIRGVVRKIVFDQGLQDDIVQECCVKLIEKEKMWSGQPQTLTGWINTLTRNVTLDFLRKNKKEKEQSEPLELEPSSTDSENDISEEQIEWVLEKFFNLSDSQRHVLHMRYYQNMSTVDIAKELNISQQAASKRVNQALKGLKKTARIEGLLPIATAFAIMVGIALQSDLFLHEEAPATKGKVPPSIEALPYRLEEDFYDDGKLKVQTLFFGQKRKGLEFKYSAQGELSEQLIWDGKGNSTLIYSKSTGLDLRNAHQEEISKWQQQMDKLKENK